MAAISPAFDYTKGDDVVIVTWSPVTESDTFVSVGGARFSEFSDRTVHILGTFGSATVVLNGSLDNTNFSTLSDPQGNAISKTSAAIEAIEENTLFVKPTHSGGTAESVTVILMMRRPPKPR